MLAVIALATSATDPVSWFGEVLSAGLTWMLALIQSVDPVLRTILAGVGILLETSIFIGLLVPGDTIVVAAATGVVGPVQFVALVLAVVLGALCGESIGFLLGRFFGPRIRGSALGRRLGERNWIRAENYLDRRGGIAVFVSRFLPILHALVPVTVGMSTMSYRRFMTWTVPASLIWSSAYVTVGVVAAGSFQALVEQLHYAGYVFVGVVIAFALVAFTVKKILGHWQTQHMDAPGDGDANTIEEASHPPSKRDHQ